MKLFGGLISISGVTFFMFSILAIAVIGYALGRITIKGVSLGDAAVFIVALLYGALFYKYLNNQFTVSDVSFTTNALKIVENLGLILFVTSVGFIAGPKFFGNIKKNFKSYVLVGLVVILSGGLSAVGCIFFGEYVMGESDSQYITAMVVGLLSGSLTSTPAFAAAKATIADINPALEDVVSAGHAIAYIFGVIGVVLFVQLIPKIIHADMDAEREKLFASQKSDKNEGGEEVKEKRKLLDIDGHGFMAFCLAAVLGIFVGMIKIPLTSNGFSGTCFSLTTTGGCLLMSLIFGHFGHIGPVNVMPKASTLNNFKEFGLILFLMGAGIAGGAEFIENFRFAYFIYGIVMTIIPLLIGYFFSRYVLKLSLLNNLGSLTGGMTSTPALGTLTTVAKTDDVASSYAATYPIALVAVVFISQFLIIIFA